MKKNSLLFVICYLLFSAPAAHAAGTYYTGSYQSPQVAQRYNANSASYQPSSYRAPTSPRAGYGYQQPIRRQYQTAVPSNGGAQSMVFNDGRFYLNAGVSRQTAQWDFKMNTYGSHLHYDNLAWNVFDVNGGYKFNGGNIPMQIDAGVKFGMQGTESTMVDDDISNGGYLVTQWVDPDGKIIEGATQIGHALSVGKTSGGSMFELNAGFGLTDIWQIGGIKITPSVGYRYLSYSLETKNNYGLSIDNLLSDCMEIGGQTQCSPTVVFYDAVGNQVVLQRDPDTGHISVVGGYDYVDSMGVFYDQPDVSHSYETTWAGPYFALDMRYDINQNNNVDMRAEIGLPGYTSTGDQPYRFDWAHPKSVEDDTGMFGALHLGLGANWNTAISDNVMLSVGLTYDYYSVSGADAKTYQNAEYYETIYNDLLTEKWDGNETAMLNPDTGDASAINIAAMRDAGWVLSDDGEIDSFYKSMGIRVGLSAKF